MIYNAYNTIINNKNKKFGLLGECHIYNKRESEFVKTILPIYKNIAMEGTGKKVSSLGIMGLLYLPSMISLMAATGRFPSEETKTAIKMAEDKGKNIFYLENTEDKTKTFLQHIGFTFSGLISIPLSPFIYYSTKKKDPFCGECIGFEERNKKKGLIEKILTYGGSTNIQKRTDLMNNRVYDYLNNDEIDNLLVICGQAHFKYMDNFFNNKFDLKKIKSEII
jgi:hypothetical protein